MEKNIMEEFEKDSEVFRKNVEAIRAIISLNEYDKCCRNYSIDSYDYILFYLADRVLLSLEDPCVKIDYKGRIDSLEKKQDAMLKEIATKYKDKISDKKILALVFERAHIPYYSKKKVNEYNVAYSLIEAFGAEVRFLASKLPLRKRKEFFIDVIKASIKTGNLEWDTIEKLLDTYQVDSQGEKKRLRDLSNSMKKDRKFLYKLIENFDAQTIINVVSDYFELIYEGVISDILKNNGGYKNSYTLIETIYNSYRYQREIRDSQKAQDIRDIIESIPGSYLKESVDKIIELDFDVNPYVFDAYEKQVIKEWDKIYSPDQVRKEIALKLLSKAKDEKDEERLKEFYDHFLEYTDIKKQTEEKRKERRHQRLLLKAAREELVKSKELPQEEIVESKELPQEEVLDKNITKELNFKKLS